MKECVRERVRARESVCVYCREVWVRLRYPGRGIRRVRGGVLKFKLRV